MAEITDQKPAGLDEHGWVNIPAMEIPSFKMHVALQKGNARKILIRTDGGLGDYITAEPAVRWAAECMRKHADISVATEHPELFRHIQLENLFDLKVEKPPYEDFIVERTLYNPEHLHGEFVGQITTHAVDYSALCLFRSQLPVAYRNIRLAPAPEEQQRANAALPAGAVIVHPGKSWPTKTFPKSWWDRVTNWIVKAGCVPVLIGQSSEKTGFGTVPVRTDGCVDLREKLSIMETVALLQLAKVVVTNDSSPLHMAASGAAHIGFISTAKHSDFVTHWRFNGTQNEWGWRMKAFAKGCISDSMNLCRNHDKNLDFSAGHISDLLPEPSEVAEWACSLIQQ